MNHLLRATRSIGCVALLVLGLGHSAGAQVIFRLGAPDGSTREFALAPGGYNAYPQSFPNDASVTLPGEAPERGWPYIQPGPKDMWAGMKTHPFTIRYTLPAGPRRDLLLLLRYADVQEAAPPIVEVTSNGTSLGQNRLRAGGGGGAFGSGATAPTVLGIRVPADTLREGGNSLTIVNVEGSWTVYDAVELVTLEKGGPRVSIETVTPTALFARDAGGTERQLADVRVANTGQPGPVTLRAAVGLNSLSTVRDLPSGITLQRIPVPSAPGPGASLTVSLDRGGPPVTVPLPVERRWVVHIVHGSHLDIGYTDLQPRVQALQNELIDRAVVACQATATLPDVEKFRWNIQSGWVLDNYLKERTPEQVRRLASCVRAGQITVSGSYVNNLYDLTNAEQLVRQVYPIRRFEDVTGAPVTAAYQIDVTGVTWQYIQALSRAGVKYLVMGNNTDHAPQPFPGPTVFRWLSPDGSSLLTWNGGPEGHYSEGYWTLNGAADPDSLAERLSRRLQRVAEGGYPHGAYLMLMMADNAPLATDLPDLVRRFNAAYTSPRIVLSTPDRFFADIERDGKKIPAVRGDWSDWWVDGAASSARETAMTRAAQERTVAAEILGSCASMAGAPSTPRLTDLDEAFRQANLYTEHTWGAAALRWGDPQWPIKRAFAERADALSRTALKRSVEALAASVKNPGRALSVAVFNSAAWPRTDVVEATVTTLSPFRLMDGTRAVPYEVVRRDRKSVTFRFVARDVPALGYRTFTLIPGPTTTAQADLRVTATTLENAYYRVTLDPATGGIRSILDKARGRNLVDAGSRYRLNQWIYRPNPGGRAVQPTTDAHEWSPTRAKIRIISRGPVRATLEVTADPGPGGSITGIRSLVQRISLTAGVPRVDIEDVVDKTRVETGEEGYFAFPFRAAKPAVTYEVPGAFVRFIADQVPGSAMDFQAVGRSVDVSNGDGGVLFSAPDAPLVEFDRIRTYEHAPRPGRLGGPYDAAPAFQPRTGHVFSHVFDNLWHTNYRIAQEGKTTFRYAIASHAGGFDAVQATRFGAGVSMPLLAAVLRPGQTGSLPAGHGRLASVGRANVEVQTVKAAARQPGYAVRLREVAGKATTVTLRLPVPIRKAWTADITERPVRALAVRNGTVVIPVHPHEMATVLVSVK